MNIMVFCEYSATVRDAFLDRGHNAWSLDILPTEGDHQRHVVADAMEYVDRYGWRTPNGHDIDLLIGHPPCTYLANSGVRWLYVDGEKDAERWANMYEAAEFFSFLLNADVPRIAIENPIPHSHARNLIGDYTQIVQPWMFGDPYTKQTCLWLHGLPELVETDNVRHVMQNLPRKDAHKIHYASPGADRWKIRSTTPQGLADAMADQWGGGQ